MRGPGQVIWVDRAADKQDFLGNIEPGISFSSRTTTDLKVSLLPAILVLFHLSTLSTQMTCPGPRAILVLSLWVARNGNNVLAHYA